VGERVSRPRSISCCHFPLLKSKKERASSGVRLRAFNSFRSGKRRAVYSWGNGLHGQLGLGTEALSLSVPTEITELSQADVVYISAAGDVSAAITEKGELYTWGKTKVRRHILYVAKGRSAWRTREHVVHYESDVAYLRRGDRSSFQASSVREASYCSSDSEWKDVRHNL